MRNSFLLQFVVGLLLVVLVASAAFLTGRPDTATKPSATSLQPTGLAAFAELLQRSGLDVVVDRHERPRLTRLDLSVSSVVVDTRTPPLTEDLSTKAIDGLEKHLKQGGTVLELRFPYEFFETDSKPTVEKVQTDPADRRVFNLTSGNVLGEGLNFESDATRYDVPSLDGRAVISTIGVGHGTWVTVQSAMGVTNQYLDQVDNAAFYVDIVRRLLKPGGRVVFTESTIGQYDSSSLTNVLGPWAQAFQWQCALLLVLMAFTVSKRFGFPLMPRVEQFGARQLVDAVAEALNRSHNADYSLDVLRRQALDTLRSRLGLHSETPDEITLSHSPNEFRGAFEIVGDSKLPLRERLSALTKIQSIARQKGDRHGQSMSFKGKTQL